MKSRLKNKKNPKQPKAVVAYETIIKKIICLDYQPSQHLEENQLVEDLGIGRTPIREALVRLQGEKMVESHPNKGVIVSPITVQNTKAMLESLYIFEFGVVDLAIRKDCTQFISQMEASNGAVKTAILNNQVFDLMEANHNFHMNFVRSSQNKFLIRGAEDARTEAKRLSYLSYNNTIDPERPLEVHYKSVVEEHDGIINALKEKNADKLKHLLKVHIDTFKDRIILLMTT